MSLQISGILQPAGISKELPHINRKAPRFGRRLYSENSRPSCFWVYSGRPELSEVENENSDAARETAMLTASGDYLVDRFMDRCLKFDRET